MYETRSDRKRRKKSLEKNKEEIQVCECVCACVEREREREKERERSSSLQHTIHPSRFLRFEGVAMSLFLSLFFSSSRVLSRICVAFPTKQMTMMGYVIIFRPPHANTNTQMEQRHQLTPASHPRQTASLAHQMQGKYKRQLYYTPIIFKVRLISQHFIRYIAKTRHRPLLRKPLPVHTAARAILAECEEVLKDSALVLLSLFCWLFFTPIHQSSLSLLTTLPFSHDSQRTLSFSLLPSRALSPAPCKRSSQAAHTASRSRRPASSRSTLRERRRRRR